MDLDLEKQQLEIIDLLKESGFVEVEESELPKYQTAFTKLPVVVNGNISASRSSIDPVINLYLHSNSANSGYRVRLMYLSPNEPLALNALKLSYIKLK